MPDRKPRIGITTGDRKPRLAWFCDWLAVRRAGGRPVRISPNREVNPDTLDGLIVGGGEDIGPDLYKGKVTLGIKLDPARDRLEVKFLKRAFRKNIPVLGICRGAQMINIALGGTLHQEIGDVFRLTKNPRTVMPVKTVTLKKGTRTFDIIRRKKIRVNSLHHQSIAKLGRGLRVSGKDRHGIIQAIENPDHPFLIGVQWHPEFLIFHREQQRLFRRLVRACN